MRSFLKYLKDRVQGKAPPGCRRSHKWPEVRAEHLKKYGECAACGSKKNLEVHHIIGFHIDPSLELDPKNLITLCEHGRFKGVNCHLFFGHLLSYQRLNIDCELDALIWRKKLERECDFD